MLRFALLGSRPLSRRCLELLHEHDEAEIAVVCTHPHSHKGWWPGSLRDVAESYGYPVVSNEEVVKEYDIDWLLSVLYYNILQDDVLSHPLEGALNLHLAELPRYRGSNVFTHAILNAREDNHWRYAATLHFMTEEVDAGDIVERSFLNIRDNDTARSLYNRTEKVAYDLFKSELPMILDGSVHQKGIPQSEFECERYHYTRDSITELEELTLSEMNELDPIELYDRIRALEFPPFDPAYIKLNDETVHLTTTEYDELSNYL